MPAQLCNPTVAHLAVVYESCKSRVTLEYCAVVWQLCIPHLAEDDILEKQGDCVAALARHKMRALKYDTCRAQRGCQPLARAHLQERACI
jgi:hypothetical protein